MRVTLALGWVALVGVGCQPGKAQLPDDVAPSRLGKPAASPMAMSGAPVTLPPPVARAVPTVSPPRTEVSASVPSSGPISQPPYGRLLTWGEAVPADHFICHVEDRVSALVCKRHEQSCCGEECHPNNATILKGCTDRSECNSRLDCAPGLECCPDDYFVESMTSMARGGPMLPMYRCAAAPCRAQEMCRPGTCLGNKSCVGADLGPYSRGQCTRASAQVHCGDEICQGDKPRCAWDAKAQMGRCVGRWDGSGHVACDDAADCARGDVCWVGAIGSFCCRLGACMDHDWFSAACRTTSDCALGSFIMKEKLTCHALDRFPPRGIHGVCRKGP